MLVRKRYICFRMYYLIAGILPGKRVSLTDDLEHFVQFLFCSSISCKPYSFDLDVNGTFTCFKGTSVTFLDAYGSLGKKLRTLWGSCLTLDSPLSIMDLCSPMSAMWWFMHFFCVPSHGSNPVTVVMKNFGVQLQSLSIFCNVASSKQLDISYLVKEAA